MKTPIYRALNRGNLFLGGDREMVLVSILMAFVCFVMMDIIAITVGLVLGATSIYLLRQMAKHDPDMRKIYQCHRKYATFYSAKSTPFRIDQ